MPFVDVESFFRLFFYLSCEIFLTFSILTATAMIVMWPHYTLTRLTQLPDDDDDSCSLLSLSFSLSRSLHHNRTLLMNAGAIKGKK